MKLLRYGPAGAERPGLLDAEGRIRDLSGTVTDLAEDALLPESIERLRGLDPASLPVVDGQPRLGPCVAGVGKFVCVGLNYSDHAAEAGLAVPEEPVLFMKATSCISGPYDSIVIPRGADKVDWEVELGFVVGVPAKYVSEADAVAHIAGFCVVNDVSERDFQIKRSGQWTKGKSCDSFGPVGPWLVTPDEVPDPQALDLWLEVDGERRQSGNTATMCFSAAHCLSYISQFMTLHTGDLVSTGTPPGVGMGRTPPVYLRPGQEVRLSVQGLGEQCQRVETEA